jgi:hypothetical protein
MDKPSQPFNIEHELGKIKVPIPLVELVKNIVYHKQIEKVIHGYDPSNQLDTLNIHDEFLTITFIPHIDNKEDCVAPFYITLNIHDKLLHKCMLDSGASHNLIPKSIME